MKHKHLPSRLLSVLLVFALLCGFAVPAAAAEDTQIEISFRQVDNGRVSADEREPAADEELTQPEYEDTDTVRVSIFLKGNPPSRRASPRRASPPTWRPEPTAQSSARRRIR